MTLTERIQRIEAERKPEPQPIAERMSPFLRKLRAKQLDAKVLYNGAWTRPDEGGAA